MSRQVAGYRQQQQPREQLVVDYADVLAQAVANERHRVLRAIREGIEQIPIPDRYPSTQQATAFGVAREALNIISRVEREVQP